MATVEDKIRVEHRARELMTARGVPAPDHIEYGFTCIRLIWRSPRIALVIDIDDEEDPAPLTLIDRPHPSQPPEPRDEEIGRGEVYDPLALRDIPLPLN